MLPLLTLFLSMGSPVPSNNEDPRSHQEKYVWSQLTAAAPFSKSYNFRLFARHNRVWAFHPSGVWVSSDGHAWKQTQLTNILRNQAFLDYVCFKDAIYGLGTFEGNIERFTQTRQIARTSDFKNWDILAKDSNLPNRFFYHPFVFKDKIWIIGGQDANKKYSDAWVSTDAIHWNQVADDLPFGARAGQSFIVFKDRLYMLAHDVWVSSDGIDWALLTPNIADGEIFGYSAEVFDDKIWLIGCNRSGRFRSEVLYSSDGITWKAERAPWSHRGGAATCVFNDQILMTGGKYGGPGIAGQTEFIYSNDVWAPRRQ
jgi:hypothetical protein